MENNNDSTPVPPVTSGSQTPTVPVGGGWGPMGYNMYPWPQMMPGWQGMQGGQGVPGVQGGQGVQGVPGMPIMQMMPGWQPGMHGWQPGMQVVQPGMQPGMPWGDNVYRPSLDFLTASSHTSTPVETQFTGCDTFSLEELGIDFEDADTPIQTGGVGRGRGASKKKRSMGKGVVGESSQPADDGSSGKVRRKWTDEENVALSKAWVSTCDDPLNSNNQRIINLWGKIAAAYKTF